MRACFSSTVFRGARDRNPNLVDGGAMDAFSWLKKEVDPSHTEYPTIVSSGSTVRQIIALSASPMSCAPSRPAVLSARTVEDMYRPTLCRTAFGALEVMQNECRRRWSPLPAR